MSPHLVHIPIIKKILALLAMLPYGVIQYYQITCQPVNQAIFIFIIMPIVFCNLVYIKIIIVIIDKIV